MGKKFSGIARDVQIREEKASATWKSGSGLETSSESVTWKSDSGLETSSESYKLSLLFKLESAGSIIPVEMRGGWNKRFRGTLANGDQVEVEGNLKDWGLEAKKIRNLTTGFEVKFTFW